MNMFIERVQQVDALKKVPKKASPKEIKVGNKTIQLDDDLDKDVSESSAELQDPQALYIHQQKLRNVFKNQQ